jgi:hypothetical protein
MKYKLLYIEDLESKSRKKDLEELGYIVNLFSPTSDLKDLFEHIEPETDAVILDYRLTKGKNNACFDAPTIAQTLRTKHKDDNNGIPLILMSNESIKVNEFDKDFTSQDLFDFVLTKEEFTRNKGEFKIKLDSFIFAYQRIKIEKNLLNILNLKKDEINLHAMLLFEYDKFGNNQIKISSLIYYDLINAIGLTIGEDVLSARLGISKESKDWHHVLENLRPAKYNGIFSDSKNRWWMEKVNLWWIDKISVDKSLRRLNAEERVELIKSKLNLKMLTSLNKTEHSMSTNFWTICKHSKLPLDPFDGIEILKDYKLWQEKEYLSIDSSLSNISLYKKVISVIDKKSLKKIASK